jgi:ribosome-binding protein aMBF1 (putative translation factor)
MKRRRDPKGYPGDECVTSATAEWAAQLQKESGLTDEQVATNIEKVRSDPKFQFLHRGVALRLRAIREQRGMTRKQLSDASNLDVRLISVIERARLRNILVGDILRLCLGLKYDPVTFMSEVDEEAKRLVEGTTEVRLL